MYKFFGMHYAVPFDLGKVPLPGFKTKIVKHLSLKSSGFLVQNPEDFWSTQNSDSRLDSDWELSCCSVGNHKNQVVKFG